jgi:hypothetical protein
MTDTQNKLLQCPVCGRDQNPLQNSPFCENCGSELKETAVMRLKNPRHGNGLKALGAFMLLGASQVFFFFSRFWGILLAVNGVLIFLWGAYRAEYCRRMNKAGKDEPES